MLLELIWNPVTLLMNSELFCISHRVALAERNGALKNGQCPNSFAAMDLHQNPLLFYLQFAYFLDFVTT